MSSDSESEVVVAESSAEDVVQRKKVKRSSAWKHFQEKDDAKAECTHCHHEFKILCKYYWLITPFEAYACKAEQFTYQLTDRELKNEQEF